jgi:hypothetical protein
MFCFPPQNTAAACISTESIYQWPQCIECYTRAYDCDDKSTDQGKKSQERACRTESAQELFPLEKEEADPRQNSCQSKAEGQNQNKSKPDTVKGDGTQQDHQGRRAR